MTYVSGVVRIGILHKVISLAYGALILHVHGAQEVVLVTPHNFLANWTHSFVMGRNQVLNSFL